MTESDDAKLDFSDQAFRLRHMALRNANYHMARRRWLDGLTRIANLVVILGGTATAAEIIHGREWAALMLGSAIATMGALQLVFDFSGRARLHEILQRRYYALMADIECVLDPTGENCAHWEAEVTRISADEPPVLRALDTIADNQATSTLRGDPVPRLKVTGWQYFTRNILAHENVTFETNPKWKE